MLAINIFNCAYERKLFVFPISYKVFVIVSFVLIIGLFFSLKVLLTMIKVFIIRIYSFFLHLSFNLSK